MRWFFAVLLVVLCAGPVRADEIDWLGRVIRGNSVAMGSAVGSFFAGGHVLDGAIERGMASSLLKSKMAGAHLLGGVAGGLVATAALQLAIDGRVDLLKLAATGLLNAVAIAALGPVAGALVAGLCAPLVDDLVNRMRGATAPPVAESPLAHSLLGQAYAGGD